MKNYQKVKSTSSRNNGISVSINSDEFAELPASNKKRINFEDFP